MSPVALPRITVAVDGSRNADVALAFAVDLARRYQSALTIIAVAPLTPVLVSSGEPWVPTEVPEGENQHYRGIVERSVKQAEQAGVTPVSGICLNGVIVDEIDRSHRAPSHRSPRPRFPGPLGGEAPPAGFGLGRGHAPREVPRPVGPRERGRAGQG